MIGDHLEILEVVWFATGTVGLVVGAVATFESLIDLRFVLANPALDEWDGRTITAKQAFRDEVAILFMQLTIWVIRLGALIGPSPKSQGFREWWSVDGTLVMMGGTLLTLRTVFTLIDRYRIWKRRRRGVSVSGV